MSKVPVTSPWQKSATTCPMGDPGMAQAQIQQQQQKGNQSADFGPDSGGRIKVITTRVTEIEDKKEKTIKNLLNAKEKISNEIADLREKIKLAKDTITKFKDEISKYQGDMSVDVSGLS
ncbi:hypothetical protein E2C01_001953 [Portunus trituberculatus]|uniref:Uncharacterized protein n=1 Tax=Portunus trituberculatus TaxID=210409 RepID=A0A5B7CKU5_PORTR|nr:hypothetical protein [Portunus trituberculatus]